MVLTKADVKNIVALVTTSAADIGITATPEGVPPYMKRCCYQVVLTNIGPDASTVTIWQRRGATDTRKALIHLHGSGGYKPVMWPQEPNYEQPIMVFLGSSFIRAQTSGADATVTMVVADEEE